jgi:hypothetical protein
VVSERAVGARATIGREAEAEIQKVGLRNAIYLKTEIVKDSSFSFLVGEALIVRIEGKKFAIEKARALNL